MSSEIPSGSTWERGANCPASFALASARSTGEDAIHGTSNHDAIEADVAEGKESKYRVVRMALDGATTVLVEAAFAIDPIAETVRYIGQRLGRKYGALGPNELPMTIDLIAVRPAGVEVWDWKSRKRVTRAQQNWQVRGGAVCAMRHLGVDSLTSGLGYLDNSEADVASFDAFDVPSFFADLRTMLERIRAERAVVESGKVPSVHSGPWCDYCPAIPHCPAQTNLAKAMLGELDGLEGQVAMMTPEQVGAAWVKLKKIEKLVESVDKALRTRVKSGPIPLPNGKRLVLLQDLERKTFDLAAAKGKLVALGEDLAQFDKVTKYDQVREVKA